MRPPPAPARAAVGPDRLAHVSRAFEDEWRRGAATLERHWHDDGSATSVSLLAALIKAELGCRYSHGERPSIAEYLDRFPALRTRDDRVVSLIYEEFCLREECGERPDPEGFCDRYPDWSDSLAVQLKYHRFLSQVVGAPPPPRFPEPGEYFEEFYLEDRLGHGGAARVYLARDESLARRKVALKVSLDRGHEPTILGKLDHRHIVPVHSVVFQTETELRGLCMPYRPGLPLDQVIARVAPATAPRAASALWRAVDAEGDEPEGPHGPGWQGFPRRGTYPEAVAWVVATLARALAYAHSQGVLHRDVKPANVLLALRDGPQLLDFNLAHEPDSPLQAAAAHCGGTLPYMAPEQLEAFLDPGRWGAVEAAADLYSLGLLMRELLTGQAPETPEPTLPLPRAIRGMLDRRVLIRDAPDPHRPSVPYALEAIVARCLAYRPADRYAHAADLADDLDRFLDRRPLRHARNPSARERAGGWVHRRRRPLAVAAVALVMLGAAAYRPAVRRIVPAERTAAFRTAVGDVEVARFAPAIRSLAAIVEEYPDAPLPWFFLSVAHEGAGDHPAACKEFGTMINLPDARTALIRWGAQDPGVARHLEHLGTRLLDGQHNKLASNAFQLALQIDPKLAHARRGIAILDESEKKYPKAHERLTRLIEEAAARNSRDSREDLSVLYPLRARVSVRLGQWLPRGAGSIDKARAYYRAALGDLDRGDALLRPDEVKEAFVSKSIRIDALTSLGEAESLGRLAAAARRDFDEARRILDRLKSGPRTEKQVTDWRRLDLRLTESEKEASRRESEVAQDPRPGSPRAN